MKIEKPKKYVHQEYPKCIYHKTKGNIVVNSLEERKALGKGWCDSPADFNKSEEIDLEQKLEKDLEEIKEDYEELAIKKAKKKASKKVTKSIFED